MMKTNLFKLAHEDTQETEEAHADVCVYFLGHEDPEKLLAAARFTTEEFRKAAERHRLSVKFGVAKTEALVVVRGTGKNNGKMKSRGKTPQSKLLVKSAES